MMRISTDNGPIRNRFGDLKAVELIARAGFDGIDYTFYEIDPHNDILALHGAQRRALAAKVRACAQDYGLDFPQAHAPFEYRYGEPQSAKSYQDVIRSMEFAAELGCRQIVIHTLKFSGEIEDADERNRAFLRSFLSYAREFDLHIGVENLFIFEDQRCRGLHASPEQMNAFVDSLDDSRFRVCCDLGHAAVCGVEPQAFIAGMDPKRLTMLHVHDTDYRNDLHTLPYLGRQNWTAITKQLAAMGYRGSMNMEVCGFYNSFPDALVPDALRMAACTARRLAQDVMDAAVLT